ncbi:MAG: amidohydrolase family protein [Bacteroidetes bacterium]|nr:amidohydrolase family protein [Bacteroidota bacterium]MBU1484268.1 amidohydrolase family protein [Bacteroidota bacterium]MBU2268208.1 amidohydrolase family protein [Bacteroidota bacterium]MBU2377067.1 amidohydrolase family protein [Bacteroidota bacterium]
MKKTLLLIFTLFTFFIANAQETYPVNGSFDIRSGQFAFTNANIVVSANQMIKAGTLIIKDKKIESVGTGIAIPKGYVVIDLKGKYIYPSLIDAFSSYGLPDAPRQSFSFRGSQPVFTSTKDGAYAWNEAIRPEMKVNTIFNIDAKKSEELKKNGFGTVNSIIKDGIARGTSSAVTLGTESANEVMINPSTAANYSFNKGTAKTDYPQSLMGAIALLRQTYLDASWYKNQNKEYNISLDEFNKQQSLPQIFEVSNWEDVLRADKVGDEFGKQYIFKSGGDEYQRIAAMKGTGGKFIIPLNFPKAYDVEDPADAKSVTYAQMKNWELAPTNPAALEKAGIEFAITTADLESSKDFWTNLRTAIDNGLSEQQALKSLTEIPAKMLGIDAEVGTLSKGKDANFLITSDSLFKKGNIIFENWVQGSRFIVSQMNVKDLRGDYSLIIAGVGNLTMKVGGSVGAYDLNLERTGTDSVKVKGTLSRNGDLVSMFFDLKKNPKGDIRLTGYLDKSEPITFKGEAALADGSNTNWSASLVAPFKEKAKKEEPKAKIVLGSVIYPFVAYGYTEAPKQETVLFKNATVWTNEKDGILQNTDVLIENGKIKAIGKNLAAGSAKVIDATGKHLTPGIIDEHSHIAISRGVNEGTQAVTAEVRIGDVVDGEDINIYRQLAGGVTTSHLLHGSANPIGGQTQLVKLRWGQTPEQMKFAGWEGFIKFALGENVKQSNWGDFNTIRFPQTRMGVEQVYVDAFTRAKEYKAQWETYNSAKNKSGLTAPRKDLELDALVEILNDTRHITCHSYVQSEINMLIHVADSMGFKINTFTHILEGYKVADKMVARGIAGSTFADWWAYKMEVWDAIPYNGKIMHDAGVLVAFNSDDAEMARRLNQEAGKAVKYGNVSKEEAFKFVTLNPAKMLHIDNKVGSLKVGKDADLVLWSDEPLSVYARAEETYVDGIKYWDIDKDADQQKTIKSEEARLIQKMLDSKNGGSKTQRPSFTKPSLNTCDTIEENYQTQTN